MAEQTLGQTLDSLVFRMGRVENWIAKWTKLQQLRVNGAKEMVTEVLDLGNAILNSRIFPDLKIGEIREATLTEKGLFIKGKLDSVEHPSCRSAMLPKEEVEKLYKAFPIPCPACGQRFKTKLSLKSHIVSDANWGRRKFRALHKEARLKQVWRA